LAAHPGIQKIDDLEATCNLKACFEGVIIPEKSLQLEFFNIVYITPVLL
jgi:hypothetical protein